MKMRSFVNKLFIMVNYQRARYSKYIKAKRLAREARFAKKRKWFGKFKSISQQRRRARRLAANPRQIAGIISLVVSALRAGVRPSPRRFRKAAYIKR